MQREQASQELVRIEREIDVKLGRLQTYHKGLYDIVDLIFRDELATLKQGNDASTKMTFCA